MPQCYSPTYPPQHPVSLFSFLSFELFHLTTISSIVLGKYSLPITNLINLKYPVFFLIKIPLSVDSLIISNRFPISIKFPPKSAHYVIFQMTINSPSHMVL